MTEKTRFIILLILLVLSLALLIFAMGHVGRLAV